MSLSSFPSQINFSRATNNGEQACSILVLLTGTGAECFLTNRCRLETHIFVVLVKLFQIFNPPWITYHVKSGNNLKYKIAKTLSFGQLWSWRFQLAVHNNIFLDLVCLLGLLVACEHALNSRKSCAWKETGVRRWHLRDSLARSLAARFGCLLNWVWLSQTFQRWTWYFNWTLFLAFSVRSFKRITLFRSYVKKESIFF